MLATRLILVEGLFGMGKTTLTRHLGERIPNSRPWFELDEELQKLRRQYGDTQ